ncbi:acyltransferase family protein [Leifsonia xyli]|uniref:acyltransferase family protein n=1 Tax=Leifsonia xyli TaxID=1575 RepID=UPI003D67D151
MSPATPASTSSTGIRLRSLDGLRGVAAFIVLLHHASLLTPAIAAAYIFNPEVSGPTPYSFGWWFTYTPLKIFTAGPEAVVVFFVLSGFVLSLPVLGPRAFEWMSYYPRRIARIGLPVVGSLLFASALALLVPQLPQHAMSSWVAGTSVPQLGVWDVIGSLDPTLGSWFINNPLWSIYWEMAFSVLLPVFVGLAVLLRRGWPLLIALVVAIVLIGLYANSHAFLYLPGFFLGVVAATQLDRIHRLGDALASRRWGWAVWLLVALGSMVLLVSHWMTRSADLGFVLESLQPIAALGLLLCCLEWRLLARLLSHQPFRWLGTISFSLYLVHVPIIITLSYLLGSWGPLKVGALAIPVALVVGTLFYAAVEKPAHRLSKRIGRMVAQAFAARPEPAAPPSTELAPSVRD